MTGSLHPRAFTVGLVFFGGYEENNPPLVHHHYIYSKRHLPKVFPPKTVEPL